MNDLTKYKELNINEKINVRKYIKQLTDYYNLDACESFRKVINIVNEFEGFKIKKIPLPSGVKELMNGVYYDKKRNQIHVIDDKYNIHKINMG